MCQFAQFIRHETVSFPEVQSCVFGSENFSIEWLNNCFRRENSATNSNKKSALEKRIFH
jgi:hypothetical protein